MQIIKAALATAVLISTSPSLAGEAGYDKGFVIKEGVFKLKTQGRVQTRYTWNAVDNGEEKVNDQHFAIQRARLKLSGTAFEKAIRFTFQTDFGKGKAGLKDFFITYKLSDAALLTMGQFKRPYSRQELTSSSKLALVDRSIVAKAMGTGRDVGFSFGSGRKSRQIEWEIGVFNGTGTKAVPDDFGPAVVARAVYNLGKIKGYSESDRAGGGFRLSAGLNVLTQLNATNDDDPTHIAGLDVSVKIQGINLLTEVHKYIDAELLGLMVQASYLLQDRYEPVVRLAQVNDADDNATAEITAGLSVYLHGHSVKWQTDFSMLRKSAGDVDTADNRLRSQFQVSF